MKFNIIIASKYFQSTWQIFIEIVEKILAKLCLTKMSMFILDYWLKFNQIGLYAHNIHV